MIGINRSLNVVTCADAKQAVEDGYDYRNWGVPPTPLDITKVVVVRRGTVSGNPTVDLLLTDETGKQFVTMVTGALWDTVSQVVKP